MAKRSIQERGSNSLRNRGSWNLPKHGNFHSITRAVRLGDQPVWQRGADQVALWVVLRVVRWTKLHSSNLALGWSAVWSAGWSAASFPQIVRGWVSTAVDKGKFYLLWKSLLATEILTANQGVLIIFFEVIHHEVNWLGVGKRYDFSLQKKFVPRTHVLLRILVNFSGKFFLVGNSNWDGGELCG